MKSKGFYIWSGVPFPFIKNDDGGICYIIGLRKDIRARIGKQPGDRVQVTVAAK